MRVVRLVEISVNCWTSYPRVSLSVDATAVILYNHPSNEFIISWEGVGRDRFRVVALTEPPKVLSFFSLGVVAVLLCGVGCAERGLPIHPCF